jgi:hypothetical protein
MIKRRDFLVRGLIGLGAWSVPGPTAQLIERLARERNEPYLVKVSAPKVVLYAHPEEPDYGLQLSLGRSLYDDDPEPITWEYWCEVNGVDPRKPRELRQALIDQDLLDPEDRFARPSLSDIVPPEVFDHYVDNYWLRNDSASARAFDYLSTLELGCRHPGDSAPLGELIFDDGPGMGNDSLLVYARDVATLAGLQQRLLQLGEEVEIRMAD